MPKVIADSQAEPVAVKTSTDSATMRRVSAAIASVRLAKITLKDRHGEDVAVGRRWYRSRAHLSRGPRGAGECYGQDRMIRFEVDAADLLHSRFALSPVFELENLLRVLGRPRPARAPPERVGPPAARTPGSCAARPGVRRAGRAPASAAAAPPSSCRRRPAACAQTIEDDLAAVRAVPLAVARAEIDRRWRARPGADPARAGDAGARRT